jgi:sugar lactone lactonase YvrE
MAYTRVIVRERTSSIFAFATLLLGITASVAHAQHTVKTIAGGGPNNLPALKSSLGLPVGIALDNAGNFYVSDSDSGRVLKIDSSENVTVVAGNGIPGNSGDGGPATMAELYNPTGLAVDSSGNLLIADTHNCVIREVSVSTGNISTIAGTSGACGYSGDGGAAAGALLNLGMSNLSGAANASGVAVDTSDDVFIADTQNCVIREISASTGVISTVAGNHMLGCGFAGDGGAATGAELNYPEGVTLDSSDDLLIADTSNYVIREVSASTGTISTIAGSPGTFGYSGDGGPATGAKLFFPEGVALDSSGNIFIADTNNCLVREVSLFTGDIFTVAGNYASGCNFYSVDGGSATSAPLFHPIGVAVDSSGNLFIADYNNAVIRKVSLGSITTFAGAAVADPNIANEIVGFLTYSGDGYPATQAEIDAFGAGMATDSAGDIFIADLNNYVVRKISRSSGIISTVAGNGFVGYSGDNGPATGAEFYVPTAVAVDLSGNLFIADTYNCLIREVSGATGIVSTVAGTPPEDSLFSCGYAGDNSPAVGAQLYDPRGLAVDRSGNLFIADTYDCTIREVSVSTGIISTVAGLPPDANGDFYCGYLGDDGPALNAVLDHPFGVAVDSSENVFIADSDNCIIREVSASTGIISRIAGTPGACGYSGDGGSALNAQINSPLGVAVDISGDIFIPDTHNCVVREISAFTGIISTVAGNRALGCGFSGDGGAATSAEFYAPSATSFDPYGDLIVLDFFRVRAVAGLAPVPGALLFPNPLSFSTEPLGTAGALAVTVTDSSAVATSVSTVGISGANAADFVAPSGADGCAGNSIPANGGSCAINVIFTPTVAGPESATLTINDSAGTQTVMLTGAGMDYEIGIASGGSTSATVAQGSTASYSLQVTASGGNPGDQISVSIACTGAPSGATCSGPASRVVATASTRGPFNVTVTTTAPSMLPPIVDGPRTLFPLGVLSAAILLLFAFALIVLDRRWRSCRLARLAFLAFAAPPVLAIVLTGCGGGGGGGGGGIGGTPAGTYTLTLTGTANGGDAHTQTLTLIVNAK